MTRVVLFALGLLLASEAAAQDGAGGRADAHEHFERGIELFNEGRLDAALAEFQAAYEIAPAAAVLYNLGRVYVELGRPVEAAEALRRYLDEGGAEITATRRAEVEAMLERATARIGRLDVTSNVEGSIVSVDGVDVATTPLSEPLAMGAGRHTIGVRAPGYESITRALDLAGGVVEHLAIELRAEVVPRGSLRITAEPIGTTISVDGVVVGETPLDATIPVPAGEHDVVGARLGYHDDRAHVTVEDGAEVDVRLDLDRDDAALPEVLGGITLVLPEGRIVIRVDGEMLDASGPLSLPVGPHVVDAEADDRAPWSGEVSLTSGTTITLVLPLTWTPDARRERLAAAESMRTGGIVAATIGAALFVSGLSVAIWNETEITTTDARIRALEAEVRSMMNCEPITTRCGEIARELETLAPRQDQQDVIQGISIGGAIFGAALGGIGLALTLAAPSEEDVDRAARAELRLGPGSLELRGSF